MATPHRILSAHTLTLPRFDGSEQRSVAVAETDDCVFASVHLDFAGKEAALRQARLINRWFSEHYGGCSTPVFLMGDMNSTPDSETIAELAGCWEILSTPDDTYPTEQPRKCIDYIMALRGAAKVDVISSAVVYSADGIDVPALSDHFPVVCRVRLVD